MSPDDRRLDVLIVGAPAVTDTPVVVAAGRAGGLGLADLAGHGRASAASMIAELAAAGPPWGVRVCAWTGPQLAELDLTGATAVLLAGDVDPAAAVAAARAVAPLVLVEVTSVAQAGAALAAGATGLVARGHESAGEVADESSFILLQHLVAAGLGPVWVTGVGRHSAAAALAAGARGVLLDRQVGRCLESRLPAAVQDLLGRCDGGETVLLGAELGCPVRVHDRPGWTAVEELRQRERELVAAPGDDARAAWLAAVAARLGWEPERHVWLLGQDAAFAAPLADTWRTVGGVVQAYREAMRQQVARARDAQALAAGGPWAAAHGTEFAVAQGPMTRVSDNPEFAAAVAAAGGLPFVALALLPGPAAGELLAATRAAVGDRPWGVGVLGFVPAELREEQLAAIRAVRPPFALIAGGRPTQAKELEADGIATYLHVPSPRLLTRFLADGATRFIFEGRECGGHIGPRTSFVLWDQAVTELLAHLGDRRGEPLDVLFAGGLHDARSAAAVAALAAPLLERGVRVGLLLGTAYLFTREAVATGAIAEGFQREALHCATTTVIETAPGHAIRVAPTPAVAEFRQKRRELEASGLAAREVAAELERLNLGRLRVASKGLARNPAQETNPSAPRYVSLDADEQRRQGLYMVGQLAALRREVVMVRALHEDLARAGQVLPEPLAEDPPAVVDPHRTAIAIIGMSTLLPGAQDVQTYWENILNRVDSVTEVSADRWDPAIYFDAEARRGGDRTYSKWGGFLDAIEFDPLHYGIPPKSLRTIEPVHLLALEAVRRALDDAGYTNRPFRRERTAVVFGAGGGSSDLSNAFGFRGMLAHFLSRKPGLPDAAQLMDQLGDVLPQWCEDTFPGILINVIAGRVANRFNFGGANFTVDAACASSLAALDAAVKELQLGHCDCAVVGGADTTQDIFSYLLFANSMVLSPRGRCRTFDESADGIAISEGVAAVVLKRLEDAERDGDRVYAVIRGLAASSDGRALGLTAPSFDGQLRAVRDVYERSGISPATVELVEAHGTGTAVGDRTEVEALTAVYEAAGATVGQVAIGSVKANIGHTKCTAGLASLVKTARAVYSQVLPPTIHVEQPNRKAGFGRNPFYPNAEPRPWLNQIHDHPRRAGVSAFGFGGTNFHCLLEEYNGQLTPRPAAVQTRSSELLGFAGETVADLREQVAALLAQLPACGPFRLRDLAVSLDRRRREQTGAERLAVVAADAAHLPAQLTTALALLDDPATAAAAAAQSVYRADRPLLRDGRLAFLFPGQGSQYLHMLGDLAIAFPAVARALEAADVALLDEFPGGLSRYLYPPSSYNAEERTAREQALTATQVAQPAVGACDAALLALLAEYGVEPELVAGHSYGEYVALYAAGVLDFASLLRLSAARGRAVAETTGADSGTMAAVLADAAQVEAVLNGAAGITLANLNSPAQTVIAGSRDAVEAAVATLQAAGLKARPLAVSAAFHSPLVAPAADRLRESLAATRFHEPRLPVYSNTTGRPHAGDIAATMARHLVEPVRFVDELNALYEAGARAFVEVGPGRVLTGLVDRTLEDRDHLAVPADAQGAGVDAWHRLLGRLWVHGAEPRLELLYEDRDCRTLDLARLAAETAPAPPAPGAWLVSGGRARPVGELAPPAPQPRSVPRAEARAQQPPAASPPLAAAMPLPPAAATVTATGDLVLDQFQAAMRAALEQQQRVVQEALESQQRLMTQYLEAQQAVLTAYLTGRPVPAGPAPGPPPPAAVPEGPVPVPAPAAAVTPSAPEPPAADAPVDLQATLLRLISERTGYPTAMLNLDLDMEAELGIDSIKRIEILGSLQEVLPGDAAGEVESRLEDLAQQKTIRQVVTWLEEHLQSAAVPAAPAPEPTPAAPAPAPESAPAAPATTAAAPGEVRRQVLRAVATPAAGYRRELAEGQAVLVLAADAALAEALADRLLALRQVPVVWGDWPATPDEARRAVETARARAALGGLVVAPQATDERPVTGLFLLAQAAAKDLQEAGPEGLGLLAVTRLGGALGVRGGCGEPAEGAVVGLVKALAKELPAAVVKVVDLPAAAAPATAAAQALDEQLSGDPAVEVGFAPERVVVRCVAEPATGGSVSIDADSVILLTGGARGITAEVAAALAPAGPTLVLVGRTPEPPAAEDEATRGETDLAALKNALGQQLRARGETATPARIEEAWRRLVREREVRANLARLREAGARVEYVVADVTDEAEFGAAIDSLYQRHGRLDGVVHGAGIIEDRRLADKTLEQFQRVLAAKVRGAETLVRRLRPDGLRFMVFFTSVAGRFGNLGQTDYAAANEWLSKLARRLDAAWPARVVAVAWGPWDEVGMVQPELRRRMRERGVTLVPPATGCQLLLAEIRQGGRGEAEVVIAALGDGEAAL